jgi:Tol biopolymer transport system component
LTTEEPNEARLLVNEKSPTGDRVMNRSKVFLLAGIILAVFLTFGFQNSSDHKVLFEEAKFTMETKGDLEGAIKLFEQILAKYPDQREYAAKSQLFIAQCYEKQGQAKAIKAYELVVKNYPDQTELVSLARSRLTSIKAKNTGAVKVTQLSTGDFYLEGGTLSPDGTRMAGVSFEIGQNIAVMNVGEDKITQVTRFDWEREGGWTYEPVWSPDGTEIAFMFGDWFDKKPGELRITTLGGEQRTLYTCAKDESIYPQQWLPTGEAILCGLTQNDGFVLGLVSVRDGNFRPLRKFPEDISGSASPNGKYIVFHEGEDGSRNLSILSVDGESLKSLTEGPADDKRPLWSPDGKHIVFLSHRHGGWALWGIEVDKDGAPKGAPFLIRDGMQNADLRNWTSSGLYYQNWIDSTDVFITSIDPQTGSMIDKPRQIDYTPTGNNKRPAWSPDGKYLAFVSSIEDYPHQGYVVIMSSAEGEAKKFPFPTQNYGAPWFHSMRWRPDGRAIGLLCKNNDDKIAFFVLDTETGQWQSWTLSEAYDRRTRMEWKGDGKAIYLAQIGLTNQPPGIIEHDLEAGQERYIYRSKYPENHIFRDLTCSRDFSKLAIMDGSRNLAIVDVRTGKTIREFTRDEPMMMSSVAWSPSGDQLFVLNRTPQGRNIKSYSILSMEDGSEETFESKGGLPNRLTYSDWSPDGTRMAFSTRSMKYEIFLLSNIIPEKKIDN